MAACGRAGKQCKWCEFNKFSDKQGPEFGFDSCASHGVDHVFVDEASIQEVVETCKKNKLDCPPTKWWRYCSVPWLTPASSGTQAQGAYRKPFSRTVDLKMPGGMKFSYITGEVLEVGGSGGSNAQKAHVTPGDRITLFEGHKLGGDMTEDTILQSVNAAKKRGTAIKITLLHEPGPLFGPPNADGKNIRHVVVQDRIGAARCSKATAGAASYSDHQPRRSSSSSSSSSSSPPPPSPTSTTSKEVSAAKETRVADAGGQQFKTANGGNNGSSLSGGDEAVGNTSLQGADHAPAAGESPKKEKKEAIAEEGNKRSNYPPKRGGSLGRSRGSTKGQESASLQPADHEEEADDERESGPHGSLMSEEESPRTTTSASSTAATSSGSPRGREGLVQQDLIGRVDSGDGEDGFEEVNLEEVNLDLIPVQQVRKKMPMLRQSYVTRGGPAELNPALTPGAILGLPADQQRVFARQKQYMLGMASVISLDFVGSPAWRWQQEGGESYLGIIDRCVEITQQRAIANSAAVRNDRIPEGWRMRDFAENGLLDGWMTSLCEDPHQPDNIYRVPIAQMLLAGSHDAFSIGNHKFVSRGTPYSDASVNALGTTQTLSFVEQLEAGVRWFDVRLGQRGNEEGRWFGREAGPVRGVHGPALGLWFSYYDTFDELFEGTFRGFTSAPTHRNEIIIMAARTYSAQATAELSGLFQREEAKEGLAKRFAQRDFTVVSKAKVREWLASHEDEASRLLPGYTPEDRAGLDMFGDLTIELLNAIYRPAGTKPANANGAFVIVIDQDICHANGLGWFETGAWPKSNFISADGGVDTAVGVHEKGVKAVDTYIQKVQSTTAPVEEGREQWRTFPELDREGSIFVHFGISGIPAIARPGPSTSGSRRAGPGIAGVEEIPGGLPEAEFLMAWSMRGRLEGERGVAPALPVMPVAPSMPVASALPAVRLECEIVLLPSEMASNATASNVTAPGASNPWLLRRRLLGRKQQRRGRKQQKQIKRVQVGSKKECTAMGGQIQSSSKPAAGKF